MGRSLRSAKNAGTRMERMTADYLAAMAGDAEIDRQIRMGALDVGDIRGVKIRGERIAVEVKDYGGKLLPAQWVKEAEIERGNLDGVASFVVAKRRGTSDPGDQYVVTTLRDMAAILYGVREPE